MARLGMDVDAVEAAARSLRTSASQVTAIKNTVGRIVSESQAAWKGRDASTFLADWRASAQQLRRLAQELEKLGRKLEAQATDQRRVSGDYHGASTGGTTDGGQRHRAYTRDEPATDAQLRDIKTRLKVIANPNIKDHYPEAYARAAEWGAELKANPSASAAEVAAFQKYCYLLTLAHVNRSDVSSFAKIAVDNYSEGSKAGIEAVVAAAGLAKAPPGYMESIRGVSGAEGISSGVVGFASGTIDWGKATLRGLGVEAVAGGNVSDIVRLYDARADSYLASLYESAHSSTTSSVVTGAAIMDMHTSEFGGRLNQMVIETEKVGAFDFMTGTGTPADSALRGVLKVVPMVSQGVSGAEVLGNYGKEAVAYDIAAEAYRQAAVGGIDSLIRAAETSGFQ